MNKQQKIRKLGNAIREYRGRSTSPANAAVVKWEQTPRPHKLKRIRELLGLLQFDQEAKDHTIKRIKGFSTFSEFEAWIKTL